MFTRKHLQDDISVCSSKCSNFPPQQFPLPDYFSISSLCHWEEVRNKANNIDEKISPFWLVKSSGVFFSKTVQNWVNSVQKEETNQAFWLVNDQRKLQIANQIFCCQIKRMPWMAHAIDGVIFPWLRDTRAFLLFLPFRNFFIYIINK